MATNPKVAGYTLVEAQRDIAALRGQLSHLVSSGAPLLLPLVVATTDITTFTVTAAALTQLSQSFTIPAGNANVGTTYKIYCEGFGVQGSTQQALTLAGSAGGVTTGSGVTFPATFAAVNGGFSWATEITLRVVTTGSGGTATLSNKSTVSEFGVTLTNALTYTGATQTPSPGTIAFNSTINNVLEAVALWGSTTGAPTLTCTGTTFERIGI